MGLALKDPADDLATYLAANSTSWTKGTNLFVGNELPSSAYIPVDAAFCADEPGYAPERVFVSAKEVRHPSVHILVRNDSYVTGHSLASDIYETIQSSPPSGYMDIACRQSGPIYLGKAEDKDVHYWSLNFWARYYKS